LLRCVIALACLLGASAALGEPAGQDALNGEIFQKLHPKQAIAARDVQGKKGSMSGVSCIGPSGC